MRIHLELDYKDEYRFAELRNEVTGPYKVLLVELDGRKFSTWYRIDSYRMWDRGYVENIEHMVAEQFRGMLEKLFRAALANVPDGVDIMSKTDEELSQLLHKGEGV
jgi:hypothetical protein